MITRPAERELPIWLRPGAICLFLGMVTILRFAVAGSTGLVRDEGYYAVWSTVPTAGYLDHPPMIAWMIAAGRALLGESELAVRLLPVLATLVTSLAVYRSGMLLFDRRIAGIGVIWFNVTVLAGLLWIAAPDAPLVMFWSLALWAVAEFAASRRPGWWLLAGAFAGLALLSKYTAGFLGLGLLLYLVSNSERRGWLLLWQVWAGAALALVVFLPNLLWNLERDWAGVAFQGRRLDGHGTSLGSFAANLGELVAGQALATGLALLVFVIMAIALFAARRDKRAQAGLALPVLTALPLLAFFLAYTAQLRVEANWLAPVWPMLSLAGGWAVVRVRPRAAILRWPLALLRSVQVPLGIALTCLLYVQAIWHPWVLPSALDRTREMRGWDNLEHEIAALAASHEAAWIAVGGLDYGLPAQLTTYGRFAGRTLPVRQVAAPHRWDFLPPMDPEAVAAPAIFVIAGNVGVDVPGQFFATVEPLGLVDRQDDGAVMQPYSAFVVSEPVAGTVAALTNR